jgi:hypothetical protein
MTSNSPDRVSRCASRVLIYRGFLGIDDTLRYAPRGVEIFAGRDVLITGGLGFIGSALVRHLVGLDAKVTLVDSVIPEYGGMPSTSTTSRSG